MITVYVGEAAQRKAVVAIGVDVAINYYRKSECFEGFSHRIYPLVVIDYAPEWCCVYGERKL